MIIPLEIKSCKECPHFHEERMYTSDSWEMAFGWFCKKADDRKIKGYVERHEGRKIQIPEWCPFQTALSRYTEKLGQDPDDDIYTIEEWNIAVEDGWIGNSDGRGYWVKDGFASRDEVFSTPQLDATHVIWYNK